MPEESTTPDLSGLTLQMAEAASRGDIDAYISHFVHDAVWQTRFGARLEGAAAIRSYHEEFTDSVEGYRFEVLEFVDLGGGVTLLVARQGGRPSGSASELLEHVAFVMVFVDGLVERMTTYSDIDEARAPAERLAEERGSAMSQENVERVRQSYEFVDREHEPDFDLLHPDIQWHTRADLPDSATHRGHASVATFMAEWYVAFDDIGLDVEELIDAGDRVVVVLRFYGRPRGSSQEVTLPETHVLTMRNGKVTEIHEYATKAEALKAVGLEE